MAEVAATPAAIVRSYSLLGSSSHPDRGRAEHRPACSLGRADQISCWRDRGTRVRWTSHCEPAFCPVIASAAAWIAPPPGPCRRHTGTPNSEGVSAHATNGLGSRSRCQPDSEAQRPSPRWSCCLPQGRLTPSATRATRINCAIAMKDLEPTARTEGLMAGDSFKTFWEACIWADHPRHRPPAHYVSVPRTTSEIVGATCLIATDCLFTAIEEDSEIIGDRTKAKRKRRESLKALGHWLGDIHQPMLISFEDDRGGRDPDLRPLLR